MCWLTTLRSALPIAVLVLLRRTVQRALDRFVRLEASRSKPGTGLGLSLVAAVASQHGGAACGWKTMHRGCALLLSLPLGQRCFEDHRCARATDDHRSAANLSRACRHAACPVQGKSAWLNRSH